MISDWEISHHLGQYWLTDGRFSMHGPIADDVMVFYGAPRGHDVDNWPAFFIGEGPERYPTPFCEAILRTFPSARIFGEWVFLSPFDLATIKLAAR